MKWIRLNTVLAAELRVNDVFPEDLVRELDQKKTGTSIQEMVSLYAVAKFGYTGAGRIVDIGCGPGGSSFALARGLSENANRDNQRVLALDIFDGYRRLIYRQKFDSSKKFDDDIEVFEEFTKEVATFVEPARVDLTVGFDPVLGDDKIEIAHIDAAKSLELWQGIVHTLRGSVIPGVTILIFQDFERSRLPFQLYSMHLLMPFGRIIGGSFFGTVYFKVEKEIPDTVWDVIEHDSLPYDDQLSATEAIWQAVIEIVPDIFAKPYPVEELMKASLAYVHLYEGRKGTASELYNSLSNEFRKATENAAFQKDFD